VNPEKIKCILREGTRWDETKIGSALYTQRISGKLSMCRQLQTSEKKIK
jgi:hypothetical protein